MTASERLEEIKARRHMAVVVGPEAIQGLGSDVAFLLARIDELERELEQFKKPATFELHQGAGFSEHIAGERGFEECFLCAALSSPSSIKEDVT